MAASFHKERKAWFQIKHQIVGTYLSLFLGKLWKFGDRVYYVDGFAGQGRLDDGTEGSALIAAKLAAEPLQKCRKGLLHCINIESEPGSVRQPEKGNRALFSLCDKPSRHLSGQTPEILKLIGNHTAFFFIDPFGTQGAEISTLKELGARFGKDRGSCSIRRHSGQTANNVGGQQSRKPRGEASEGSAWDFGSRQGTHGRGGCGKSAIGNTSWFGFRIARTVSSRATRLR